MKNVKVINGNDELKKELHETFRAYQLFCGNLEEKNVEFECCDFRPISNEAVLSKIKYSNCKFVNCNFEGNENIDFETCDFVNCTGQDDTTRVKKFLGVDTLGNLSDGSHTFNELYHHRAMLFAAICNLNKGIAWKSKKHYDGTMETGWFVVGVNTPQGQATYHYSLKEYWDLFKVKELEKAPEWDGHTPKQAIERIYSISL